MTYLKFVIISVLLYETEGEGLVASDFLTKKNCSIIRTFKLHKQISPNKFYFNPLPVGNLGSQKKFGVEEIEVSRIQPICCDGYQNYDEQSCLPVCSKSCGHRGICSAPEVCSCEEGYAMDRDLRNCKPVCELTCELGPCLAPNVCPCEEGYRWSQDEAGSSFDEVECKPICNNCAAEETCFEPHICKCKQGYTREVMDRPEYLNMPECKPVCDKPCVNSACIGPNYCECFEKYTRIDAFTCDTRMHVVTDFAIIKNCSQTVIEKETETGFEEISYYDKQLKKYTSEPDYRFEVVLVNKTVPICCDGYQNFDEEKCIPVCSKNCGIYGICSAPNVCTCHEGSTMNEIFQECKPGFT